MTTPVTAPSTATLSLEEQLRVFSSPALKAEIEIIERLLSQSRQLVLMGAGCSCVAGLPLTAQLFELVKSQISDEKSKQLLAAIHEEYKSPGRANLEDFLTDMVDLKAMADRRELRGLVGGTITYGGKQYSATELRDALAQVKHGIRQAIGLPKAPVSIRTHRKFVRAMHDLHMGKAGAVRRTDYFVLNYDTLVEDALGQERIPYSDGLAGGPTGWWNPSRFDEQGLSARVIKLHGSIDWCLFENEFFPSRLRPTNSADTASEQVMIWPSSAKYRETQLDPFAQVLDLFRKALRPTASEDAVLMVMGYSFGDDHINLEIQRGLQECGERLSILVFCFEDVPPPTLASWLKLPGVGAQIRAYCRKELWHGSQKTPLEQPVAWGDFRVMASLLRGER